MVNHEQSPESTAANYDPGGLSGNMHLSEAEIRLAIQMNCDVCHFDTDFASLKHGDALTLNGTEQTDKVTNPLVSCRLRLFNVEGGLTYLVDEEKWGLAELSEDFVENPPCKMFEAVILEHEGGELKRGDEVFGFLFPEGKAIVVDSGPEDDLTNRRILAMIAFLKSEQNREASSS